jgi:ABC-type antimicrobial peptide transport system permease subunit
LKIILKYIVNNVKEQKLRTAVMLLSIVLSSTLLFVSLAIGASYNSAQQKMAKGSAGVATVEVSAKPGKAGAMVWISEEEIPPLASIKSSTGFITTAALYSKNNNFENFDLIAADLTKLNTINKPRLIDGSELTDFSGYSIVIQEKFTSKYGIKVGDPVVLNIGGKTYEFKLAAIAAYDKIFLRQTRGFTALIPKETLAEILKTSGGYSKIMLEPAKEATTEQLITELTASLDQSNYSITKAYDEAQIREAAKQKSLPFYLISFFSLVMSVFIIFSSYKVITMERLPVIGTFRSIGATAKGTAGILIMESLVYGVAGGLISVPLGFGGLKLILNGLGKSLSIGIEIPMVVQPANIILSFMMGVVISILSAYIPIRRASKLPLKEVVLGTVEEKNTSNKIKLGIGVAIFVISVILPWIVGDKNEKLLMAAGGFSLLGMIVSTIIIVPLIVNALSFILEQIYGVILGNEGKLAARNMRQNKNVNQNVSLLILSLSAVVVISVITSIVTSFIGDVFKGGALDGFTDGDISNDFLQEVKSIEGIDQVLAIYELSNRISTDNVVFGQMEAVDDISLLRTMLNLKYQDRETQLEIENTFLDGRNVLLSRDCLKERKLRIGDTIRLSYHDNSYKYKILGSFQSRADSSEAIIPGEYAKSDFDAVNYRRLAFTAADPEAVIVQIRNLFGNKYNWSRTVEEFRKDALGIINAFTAPMKNLTYFILLLAIIGIINNLLINYIQKRRAIAMYKSVGLSNRQNRKMILTEAFTSGVIGAVIGSFISYMEIRTIFIVAGPKMTFDPEIDPIVFVISGSVGIIITMIGSFVPILKGSKMKLIEEIKFE